MLANLLIANIFIELIEILAIRGLAKDWHCWPYLLL